MKARHTSQHALRWSPLALAIAFACSSGAVYAQDDTTQLERIEVTGSRIKKTEIEGQSPIFTIDRDDIDQSGVSSIGDLLQELTTSGSSLNTKFNSSGNFGYAPDGGGIGAGSSQVSLRHLGAQRTLVLVDGLRWINESSASGVSGAVDLNTIPLAIVERIEVLEDGASAIYGSDAIAGVVNIITRKDYDGAEVSAYYGEFDEGDGETTRADMTIGGGGERFNAVFVASYADQDRVSAADRSLSLFPVPGTGLSRASSATAEGRFIFTDPRTGNTLNLGLIPGTGTPLYIPATPTSGGSTYRNFSTQDRFNFSPFNLVITPNERKSLFTQVRFELTDSVSWWAKGVYNNRSSVNQAAPEPIFIGSDAGTGGLADTLSISRLNPFNPFGIDLVNGENFFFLGRRPIEGGPRIYSQEVDTYYFATGLEGSFDFGDRAMFWDVNYVNSENRAKQTQQNNYNVRAISFALGDPAICAATPGCVPLNLFGGQGANGQGTITPEMLDYVQYNAIDESEQTFEVWSANLTGDLFELPAGPLAFATGYEHREYAGFFQPDPLKVSGESNDVLAQPTSGEYDVDEYYAELNVPILADVAGAKRLDASIAGRYSDYSTFGGESTYKAGLRWQPTDDLVVRGTYAEGFRAPTIGEAFGSATRFDAQLQDPCSGNVTANCTALGVPAGYEQNNPQISVTTGGNPDLTAETADSFTAGFVYSPSWAEGIFGTQRFDIEATYYDHEIKDAIAPIDALFRLTRCVESADPNSLFCQGITRTSTGQINSFSNRLVNLSTINTDGFDLKFDWTGPDTDWGRFSARWQNTFVNDYERIGASGEPEPQAEGREVNDSAIPEWQSNFQLNWNYGDWLVGWTIRHIDEVTEDCSDSLFQSLGLCSHPEDNNNELDATTYHDVQVGWSTPLGVEGLKLIAGVSNVFDEDPPTCLTCSLNGYDAGTYDIQGQFWYVQASYKF